MKKIFLLIILLSVALSSLNDASFIRAEVIMSGSINNAELMLHIPSNDTIQQVTQKTSYQILTDDTGDYIKVSGDYEFRAEVAINRSRLKIISNENIPFLSEKEYAEETELIDSNNPFIIQTANMITGKSEKVLEITADIVEWVFNNMKYDISYSATNKRKASEVLSKRIGVCSDYSILTAALLRAKGVPVKYVEGYLLEENTAIPHAWLEVYDGTEWFPIDPTNGNMLTGANLLKIQEGKDPSNLKNTVKYFGANPVWNNDGLKSSIIDSKKFSELFTTSLTLDHEKVGIGSSNAVNLMIKNLKEEFLTPSIITSANENLITSGETFSIIVLRPLEAKVKTWPVMVKNSLNDSYVYELPFVVSGPGFLEKTSIKVDPSAPVYSSSIIIESIKVIPENNSILLKIENKGNKNALIKISLISRNNSFEKNINMLQNQEEEVVMTASEGMNTLKIEWEGNKIIRRITVQRQEETQTQYFTIAKIKEEQLLIILTIIIIALVGLILKKARIKKERLSKKQKKKERREYKKHALKRQIEKSLEVLRNPEEHGVEELEGKPKKESKRRKRKVFKKH